MKGTGDRFLNHLYTNKKWHVRQERIQIAESITPTAHLINTSPTRSIDKNESGTCHLPLSENPSRDVERDEHGTGRECSSAVYGQLYRLLSL